MPWTDCRPEEPISNSVTGAGRLWLARASDSCQLSESEAFTAAGAGEHPSLAATRAGPRLHGRAGAGAAGFECLNAAIKH